MDRMYQGGAGLDGVLVVDDDERTLRALVRPLRAYRHYAVHAATTTKGALDIARMHPLKYAVVDLMLAADEESGIDVIERLKELQPSVQAVLLSARPSISVAVEAMRRGASSVEQKPITVGSIISGLANPRAARPHEPLTLDEAEREYVARTLSDCGGNVSLAASSLGISRTRLYRIMRS